MNDCLTKYRQTQTASQIRVKAKASQCAFFLAGCLAMLSSEAWAHGKASSAEAASE